MLREINSANELRFELGQQVEAVEPLEVVEAVGVLQAFQLDFEDERERRPEHARRTG